MASGRHEEAVASYDLALLLDPGDADTHYLRGKALQHIGRYQEAVAAYDQALTLDPGDPYVAYSRGTALVATGRHQDALAAYDYAHDLRPQDSVISRERNAVIMAMGVVTLLAITTPMAKHFGAWAVTGRRSLPTSRRLLLTPVTPIS